MITRLAQQYKSCLPDLMQSLQITNEMAAPKLKSVTLSMGLGKFSSDQKVMDKALNHLTHIGGQKAVFSKAKKSIAAFNVRQGTAIGAYVHLRRGQMYNFMDRLVYTALANIRDFQGWQVRCLDGQGGCNLGIKDVSIFLEVEDGICGMNIAINTTAKTKKSTFELLKVLGLPFQGEII